MPNEQKALWEVRKAGLNIMMSMKGDGKPVSFIEDCAVPLEHLAEYTSRLTEVFHRHGTEGTWYAHASVGTLHVRPILDMRRDGALEDARDRRRSGGTGARIQGRLFGRARRRAVPRRMGGVAVRAAPEPGVQRDQGAVRSGQPLQSGQDRASAEDGRRAQFPLRAGLSGARASRPRSTGPHGTSNVIRSRAQETLPGTGNDLTGGLAKAVEMCNNNGHCRKFDAGTMCPSYRVTKDEQHVTRGRANTLRLAISGQLGEEGLASDDVKDTLDLCVSCKGCKRDCPTGVDMAKFKIEARAARVKRHGLRLRDRLVAFMPRYAPFASRMPALDGAG